MKRGIIVAVDERFLTLLTHEGEFCYSHKYEAVYEIGQEIEFEPIVKFAKPRSERRPKYIKAMVLAVVVLFSFLGISSMVNHSAPPVFAYMTMDINPSIEFAVNERFEVVHMEGYNEEGQRIVAELSNWQNKQFDLLFSEVLSILKSKGYIQSENELTFATVLMSDQKNSESMKKHMDFVTREVKEENLNLTLVEGSKAERQLAQKQGLTLGAYKDLNEKSTFKDTVKSDSEEEYQVDKEAEKENDETNEQEKSIKEGDKETTAPSSKENTSTSNEDTNESNMKNERETEAKSEKDQREEKQSQPSSTTDKPTTDSHQKDRSHYKDNHDYDKKQNCNRCKRDDEDEYEWTTDKSKSHRDKHKWDDENFQGKRDEDKKKGKDE